MSSYERLSLTLTSYPHPNDSATVGTASPYVSAKRRVRRIVEGPGPGDTQPRARILVNGTQLARTLIYSRDVQLTFALPRCYQLCTLQILALS